MSFCFLSPGAFTGGPLALHQAAASLRQMGVDASILYINGFEINQGETAFVRKNGQIALRKFKPKKLLKFWKKRAKPEVVDPRLKKFNVPGVEAVDLETHFVLPEVWPDLAAALLGHGCPNVHLWWLSVDNFPLSSIKYLSNQQLLRRCHNLCQSEYAVDFVRSNGGKRVTRLTDFIDMEPVDNPRPLAERNYDICYLPNKARGSEDLWQVLQKDFKVIQLQNMSRAEIQATLSDCKIFLDCGFHPGKDRVPREAALCGCLPVVRQEGAAKYPKDVPLTQDLLVPTDMFFSPEDLRKKLHNILRTPEAFEPALAQYREAIKQERQVFEAELRVLAAMASPQRPLATSAS